MPVVSAAPSARHASRLSAALAPSRPPPRLSPLDRVFYLDGDAIINDVRKQVGTEILAPYLTQAPHVHLLLNCHSPFGTGGDCGSCRCCRARECPESERTRLPQADGSWINAGVVFIRNSAEGRELVRWWASAGYGACATDAGASSKLQHGTHDAHGRGRASEHALAHRASRASEHGGRGGHLTRGLAEQECAQRMQRKWPSRVEVLNARVFNAPLWFEPAAYQWFELGRHSHNDVVRDVVAAEKKEGRSGSAKCLGSAMFVCHAYDAPADFRALVVPRRLAAVRPILRTMLAAHGDEYLSFSAHGGAPAPAAFASSSGAHAVAPSSVSAAVSAAAAAATSPSASVAAHKSAASFATALSASADSTAGPPGRSRRGIGGGSRSTLEAKGCSDPGCCLRHPRMCVASASSLASSSWRGVAAAARAAAAAAAGRVTSHAAQHPRTTAYGPSSPALARATPHAAPRAAPYAAAASAAAAAAAGRATSPAAPHPHAAPRAAPYAARAAPHGHAKTRGSASPAASGLAAAAARAAAAAAAGRAASLAASPARGGNCTGLHIAINSNLRFATHGSNPMPAAGRTQLCHPRLGPCLGQLHAAAATAPPQPARGGCAHGAGAPLSLPYP